ncbi:hypothetical protein M422DRAFT_255192 [Sphaerobolus stellatus SS14]|uniref:Uncharacterized protein n=1 Tax=Sphaerobolus stellatus (strain SS14) TaxID=990650 RepID=A0A0C9VUF3_SPHS4|nr:hypothetical protein M422DRAFT_255192 [Sphaerobolus stellatus SS14]
MSPFASSSNAADLLSCFRNQKAKRDGPHIEVGAVPEHLLEDIEQCPTKFSFLKDEILEHLNEVWPQIGTFITTNGDEHKALEEELYQGKSDNHQLQGEIDDLQDKIQTLETQLVSLHMTNTQVLKDGLTQGSVLGTPLDFRLEPFRSELPLTSTTLTERFRTGFTLNTFVDSCGWRVGGLVGDSGHLVEGICACSHSA